MSNINEGLRTHDMKGMVDSIVSIDQFKPKIDSEAEVVVVAFSVQNDFAAKDLNDFIQTGAVEHLDTEPSPGPDEFGVYKVFVEFQRDKELYDRINKLLLDINHITSDKGEWEFTAYKLDEPRKFDEKRFKRDIAQTPEEYKAKHEKTEEDEVKERMEFLVKY